MNTGLSPRGADDNYCCLRRPCTGTGGCELACFGTGLPVGVAFGLGGGPDVGGRSCCSEALAIRPLNCSWVALSCLATAALSRTICSCAALSSSATAELLRTICSWLVLSCSMPVFSGSNSCSTAARKPRAVDWSSCSSPGDRLGCAGTGLSAADDEIRESCGSHHCAITCLAASPCDSK